MVPLKVSFQDIDPSTDVTRSIEHKLQKLERIYDRLGACEIDVRAPQHQDSTIYHVHIRLDVPGGQLVVNPESSESSYHDVHVALSDAFRSMGQQLDEFALKWSKEEGRQAPEAV